MPLMSGMSGMPNTPVMPAMPSAAHGPGRVAISDAEFDAVRRFIRDAAGIHLSTAKKALVCSRLHKRLAACQVASYTAYLQIVSDAANALERQVAIDLLTTNETYFFREPAHFEALADHARRRALHQQELLRAWSAASSTGEEAFSMAMTLADVLGCQRWEVLGTDISTRVVAQACAARYPMTRASRVTPEHLKRYCLKGVGAQAGMLRIAQSLRDRVRFAQANLMRSLPELGTFDVIFLRNVLIYFDLAGKAAVLGNVTARLRPGGLLCVGHAESLQGIAHGLVPIAPSMYRRS
jgi:chemotaxis protein methyltransferase CheR